MSVKAKYQLMLEKFYKGAKIGMWGGEKYTEIFVNPTQSEVEELEGQSEYKDMKGVRLGVDNKGLLYAWRVDVLHHMVERSLKKTFVWKLDVRPLASLVTVKTDGGKKMKDVFGKNEAIKKKVIGSIKKAFPRLKKLVDHYWGGEDAEIQLR